MTRPFGRRRRPTSMCPPREGCSESSRPPRSTTTEPCSPLCREAEENSIVALTIADDYASLAVGRVLLERHPGYATMGGPLVIGPDGMLWIGTGDDFEPENGLFPIQGVEDLEDTNDVVPLRNRAARMPHGACATH